MSFFSWDINFVSAATHEMQDIGHITIFLMYFSDLRGKSLSWLIKSPLFINVQ